MFSWFKRLTYPQYVVTAHTIPKNADGRDKVPGPPPKGGSSVRKPKPSPTTHNVYVFTNPSVPDTSGNS